MDNDQKQLFRNAGKSNTHHLNLVNMQKTGEVNSERQGPQWINMEYTWRTKPQFIFEIPT